MSVSLKTLPYALPVCLSHTSQVCKKLGRGKSSASAHTLVHAGLRSEEGAIRDHEIYGLPDGVELLWVARG
jgi:hypothetical protein